MDAIRWPPGKLLVEVVCGAELSEIQVSAGHTSTPTASKRFVRQTDPIRSQPIDMFQATDCGKERNHKRHKTRKRKDSSLLRVLCFLWFLPFPDYGELRAGLRESGFVCRMLSTSARIPSS